MSRQHHHRTEQHRSGKGGRRFKLKLRQLPLGDPRCPSGGILFEQGSSCKRKQQFVVCNGANGRRGQACGAGTLRTIADGKTFTITTVCATPGSPCAAAITDPASAVPFDVATVTGTVTASGLTGLHIATGGTVVVTARVLNAAMPNPCITAAQTQVVFLPDAGVTGGVQIVSCSMAVFGTVFPTTFIAPGPGTFQVRVCSTAAPCSFTYQASSVLTVEHLSCPGC
jgi:hypothetical protein